MAAILSSRQTFLPEVIPEVEYTRKIAMRGEVRMRTKQQLWTNVPQILLAHVLYQQQLSSKTVHRVWEIT